MKLQSKLFAAILPLIIVPLLVLSWLAYSLLQETATETKLHEMQTVLEQIERNITHRLHTAQVNVELFANSSLLQKYVLIADEQTRYSLLLPALLEQFSGYQKGYPDYYEIRLLLPNGYEDARSVNREIINATEEEHDTAYFQRLRLQQDLLFAEVIRNPDDEKYVLLVAKPIRTIDPSIDPLLAKPLLRAYLAVTVDLAFIAPLIYEYKIGRTGWFFITNGDGKILFHPDETLIDTWLVPERFKQIQSTARVR